MANFDTLVVGTDFSPCAEAALRAVTDLAPRLGTRRVHVVSVVQVAAWVTPPLVAASDLTEAAFEETRRRLDRLEIDIPQVRVTREARLGSAPRELAAVAETEGAGLIVTATHGRTGLTRAVLGSVTSTLVRLARVPVLVVPGEEWVPRGFERVLAAVDLSPVSKLVVELAATFAATSPDGRVRALSLFEHPLLGAGDDLLPHYTSPAEIEMLGETHRQEVEHLVRRARQTAPIDVEVLSKAPPFRVILDVADLTDADLIAVGTSGRNAWHRMIVGSTATRILTEGRRPVLVVPSEVQQEAPEPSKSGLGASGRSALPVGG